jgi:AcrR family transcriptional regulator
VARTVNRAAHELRRDEFLDVTQRLLETKGYAQMSVQDVLSELGASKGAFYHYFDSKQGLLDAVVTRLADATAAALAPIARDSGTSALDRLQTFFAALAQWKTQRWDLLRALLQVWYSDDNAVLRQKLRPGVADRIAPLLAEILRAGAEDGTFTVGYPGQTGRVVVSLVQDLNDRLAEILLAADPGKADLGLVEESVAAYTDALERILGVPNGSVVLVEMDVLRPIFGPPVKSKRKMR